MTEQFGRCVRCNAVSTCFPGKHNLILLREIKTECYHQYAYDLCNECIDGVLQWVEVQTSKEALQLDAI